MKRALVLSLYLLVLPPALAAACELSPAGDSFDLSTGRTTQRLQPAPAYNVSDDQYMVVWFDTRNPGNNDVFGQRVTADGALAGTNFPVIELPEAQIDPWIAHDPASDLYLVAWRTQQAGFFNRGRARRIAADGTPIGGDFLVGNGHEISIAYNGADNQFLVTGRSPDIRGQRVSDAGTLVGPEILISNAGAPAPNGQVGYDSLHNRYLATWRDQVSEDLRGQLIDAGGALIGGPILISSTFPSSGRAASVAFDRNNDRYLAVFGMFQATDLLGQLVASDGTLVGTNFTIASGLSEPTDPFVVYSDPARSYVVVWKDGTQILAQAVTEDGSLAGAPLIVERVTAVGDPTAAASARTGSILVVWTDDRNLAQGEEDIFGRIVSCGNPAVAQDDAAGGPAGIFLDAYPNPTATATRFRFGLERPGPARVEVLGADGRLIRSLEASSRQDGEGFVEWDGRDRAGRRVPGGIYFCRLRAGSASIGGGRLLVVR